MAEHKIDARTVELDPQTLTPIARDFQGGRYRFYCSLSDIALHNSGEVRELPLSLKDLKPLFGIHARLPQDQKKFDLFKKQQLEQHGSELELGVAVGVLHGKIFFGNDDIGIWEGIPEPREIHHGRYALVDEFKARQRELD